MQYGIDYFNSPVTIKEIKFVSPEKKSLNTDDFIGEFFQTSEEELAQILHNLFQKTEEMGTIASSFYEASISLITKPDEDSTKKETKNQYHS